MDYSAVFQRFARTKLLEEMTPIQRLERLERELGSAARLYVKRDDLMGLGGGGNDDLLASKNCAIRQDNLEAGSIAAYFGHASSICSRAHLFLKPLPVIDKCLSRDALDRFNSDSGFVCFKGEFGTWIGYGRRLSRGSEKHACGHSGIPELHGLPENPRVDP